MKVKYQDYVYKIIDEFTEVMCNPKVKLFAFSLIKYLTTLLIFDLE